MQIKAYGRLVKVVANYPLPTTDNLLVHFKDGKYFSTLAFWILPYQANTGGSRGDSLPN